MAKKNKKSSPKPQTPPQSNGDSADVSPPVQTNGVTNGETHPNLVESSDPTTKDTPKIQQNTADNQDTDTSTAVDLQIPNGESSAPSEAIELSTIAADDDAVSIKSTDAVLDTNKDDLNTINLTPTEVNEQELNPDLAKFMHACQEGNLTVVKDLISSKTINASDTFSDGITGLHWACINNRLTLVKYLTQNEYSTIDPNAVAGELRATPLHWACRNGLVYIVDYLISETDADPSITDGQSYNALHLAVHSSNITLVTYILLTCCDANSKKPLYVDEPDSFNRTSLHWAAYQGDILTINALLEFGADVTKRDNTGFIPLHWSFMKGYKPVFKKLLDAGSDIHLKNDSGKDTFDIAQDMNCVKVWHQALLESGRDPKNNWNKKSKRIEPKLAKLITFFAPYVFLPITFQIASFGQGYWIPKLFAAALVFGGSVWFVSKLVVPIYLPNERALALSPFLSGVFSGTAFWAVVVWLFTIVPSTFFSGFFSNVALAGLVSLCMWTFFKSMFINPGFVPIPSDKSVILGQVKDLIAAGKFDTDHFCVETMVRKPLRSKYSRISNKLVARFDHYCPWVYNDIGVRNHKLFMTFIYSLNLVILLFVRLSNKYFDKLEDGYESDAEGAAKCSLLEEKWCYAYTNKPFHFNIMIWCLFQYIWIVSLCLVQTFQVLKGLTTREFSMMNKRIERNRFNHGTLPRDFANGDSADNFSPPPGPGPTRGNENGLQLCMKLLGLEQFILTIKLSLLSLPFIRSYIGPGGSGGNYEALNSVNIPTDHGFVQNWLDFWVLGDLKFRNVFYLPIEGENNLNGKLVDYYKLYEYPSKEPSEIV